MTCRRAWEQGIAEFNRGAYFACHESLEEIWRGLRGEPRRFVQGIIHAAAGFLHIERSNPRGAISQLSKGVEKLEAFPSPYLGIDLEHFLPELRAWRDDLRLLDLEEERMTAGRTPPGIVYVYTPDALAPFEGADCDHE